MEASEWAIPQTPWRLALLKHDLYFKISHCWILFLSQQETSVSLLLLLLLQSTAAANGFFWNVTEVKPWGTAGMVCCPCGTRIPLHRTSVHHCYWGNVDRSAFRGCREGEVEWGRDWKGSPVNKHHSPLSFSPMFVPCGTNYDEIQANMRVGLERRLFDLPQRNLFDNTIVDEELSLNGFGTPLRLDLDNVSSLKKYGVDWTVCVF